MSPRRLSYYFLSACLLGFLYVTLAAAQAPMPPTIAVVNGKPLTAEAFHATMEEGFARRIFEVLVHRRLVFDEAERIGITLSRAEFEQRVAAAKGAYPSEADFQAGLRQEGITEAYFLQRLKTEVLLDKIVEKRGTIPDGEVAAYYEKHKDRFVRPAEVYLWDFSTPELEAAYAMARRMNAGERLSETAEGLTVGWHSRAQIADPLMRETAFALEIGQASSPIYVEGNYHVLFVSESRPGLHRSLQQARPDIVEALRQEKGLTREAVLDSLVRDARIQINWDPLRYLNAEYLALKQIRILVDGKPLALPRPVLVVGDRLLVPAKPVAQALGARLTWVADSSTLVAERGSAKVTFTAGKPVALVGSTPAVTVAPRIEGGILLVEARPLIQGLGAALQWEPGVNTLYIKSPEK